MNLGSLFSGIGAFELAGSRAGLNPRWSCEIDIHCNAVTAHHFPDTQQLGDITKVNGADIEPVDVLCLSPPCTNLSVAGKRAGFTVTFKCKCSFTITQPATSKVLYMYTMICPKCGVELTATNESALFFNSVRVIEEMLNATDFAYPRYLVFENVPGMLSSNGGDDWLTVMDELSQLGFALDVNTLDAQHMGVPQRRKRVFIVGKSRNHLSDTDAPYPDLDHLATNAMRKAVQSWGGELYNLMDSWRYEPVKTKLSDVLETTVSAKYLLSSTAINGVSNRAEKRGKILPQLLTDALVSQLGWIDDVKALGDNVYITMDRLCVDAENTVDGTDYLHIQDSQANRFYTDKGVAPTLSGEAGGGGARFGGTMVQTYPINTQVATRGGKVCPRQGFGVGDSDDPQFTLLAGHEHAVCQVFGLELGAMSHGQGERMYPEMTQTPRTEMVDNQASVLSVISGYDGQLDIEDGQVAPVLRTSPRDAVCIRMREGKAGGGKCPLISNDLSITLATGNDQTLIVLNDQGGSSINVEKEEVSPTLRHESHGHEPVIAVATKQLSQNVGVDVANPLYAQDYKEPQVGCYSFDSLHSNSMKSNNPHSGCRETDLAQCLTTGSPCPAKNQGGIAIVVAYDVGNGQADQGVTEELMGTLNTMHDQRAVLIPLGHVKTTTASGEDVVGCILANCGMKQWLGNQEAFAGKHHIVSVLSNHAIASIIRRLLPIECERLMGFPDNWTDVPTVTTTKKGKVKVKPASDSQRYKQCGNSIAIPQLELIFDNIVNPKNPQPKGGLVQLTFI